ncbi:MAG: hypothetical protein ACI97B_000420 [Verrucomicrobiales bacterium]|jgi:hypothetical protein
MKQTIKSFLGVAAIVLALVMVGCETPDIKFGGENRPDRVTGEMKNELIIIDPVGVSPTERGLPPVLIDTDEEVQPKRNFLKFWEKKEVQPVSDEDPSGPVVTEELAVEGRTLEVRSQSEEDSIDGGVEYRLQVGDNVVVKIGPPISTDLADKLNGKGNINLPIIGDISAVGLTVTELEELIKKTYVVKEITKVPPHVTVATDIKVYYIQGEVRSGGGRFPLLPPMTITKAVAAAGGFSEWASLKKVLIYRGNKILTVDYRKIQRDPRLDIEIKANDLIVVNKDPGIGGIFDGLNN